MTRTLSQSSQVLAFLTSVSISSDAQVPPVPARLGRLLVAQVVFVLARRQILWRDELPAELLHRDDLDLTHGGLLGQSPLSFLAGDVLVDDFAAHWGLSRLIFIAKG